MKTAFDPRHKNRVNLMQHLYSSQFQRHPDPVAAGIWDHLAQIDPLIGEAAPEWPVDKLNPIDLAILRLAIYELTIDRKVPFKVIIDEAIELAKEYGSSNSPGFINGALGKLVQDQHLEETHEPQP
jgi:transcription antitermination protein NusB